VLWAVLVEVNMHNPFDAIYKRCNSLTNLEKDRLNNPFPRLLDIELTNQCNLECRMCPTGLGKLKREEGFIDSRLISGILDDIAGHYVGIRFVRWGEPLLHSQLLLFLISIKRQGLPCHINTNGVFSDEEFLKDIVKLELDSIKFSFQGLHKGSYKKMRGVDHFDQLTQTVIDLHELRGKKKKPFIQVGTTVTDESEQSIIYFKKMFSEFSDRVTVGKTKNLFGAERGHIANPCPELWDKLSVNWDGTVSACCADFDKKMVVGNLADETIEEIWNGKKLKELRQKLLDGKLEELEVCRRCFL
jgi:radical SAM protein with 4Fe4S-binding SPASM domain